MKITQGQLKRMIREELNSLRESEDEPGELYTDMTIEKLKDTMASTRYQKVYLFAKLELGKREDFDGKYPEPHSKPPKEGY